MAIMMHCNLRPPDASPVIPVNYDAHTKFEVVQPICYRLIGVARILSGVHFFLPKKLTTCFLVVSPSKNV